MIVSNSPFKYQVASVLVYFRDLLLGVFFITIGMQVDVVFAAKYFIVVLILCALMILVKTLIMFAFLSLFRRQELVCASHFLSRRLGNFPLRFSCLQANIKF